ncbi:MAG: lamin tail domain-containing protein, partial [Planctomycetota bacterium]
MEKVSMLYHQETQRNTFRNVEISLLILVLSVCAINVASAGDALGQTVVINEFLASNSNSIQDPQGQYDDWIELYNYGVDAVDIGGMYLTDDLSDPTKWRILPFNPHLTTIRAGGYLLIWADNDVADAGLHANFKLDANGEDLGLFGSDGVTLIDNVTFGDQTTDVSYGRHPDAGDDWQFFAFPSPAAENVGVYEGFVADVQFSHE